jgi:hypothetical protein
LDGHVVTGKRGVAGSNAEWLLPHRAKPPDVWTAGGFDVDAVSDYNRYALKFVTVKVPTAVDPMNMAMVPCPA